MPVARLPGPPLAPLAAVLLGLAVLPGCCALPTGEIARRVIEAPPVVAPTVVRIDVAWPEARPEDIEAEVTRPVEHAIQGLDGVTAIRSASLSGLAHVEVELAPGVDRLAAATAIREALAGAPIPDAADDRVVSFAPGPLAATLLVTADDARSASLRARELVRRIEAERGVAMVEVHGGGRPQVEVTIDAERAVALGIPPAAVTHALRGTGMGPGVSWLNPRPLTVEDLTSLVVGTSGGAPVLVGDLASVTETLAPEGPPATLDGRPVVALDVYAFDEAAVADALAASRARAAELGGEVREPTGAVIWAAGGTEAALAEAAASAIRAAEVDPAAELLVIGNLTHDPPLELRLGPHGDAALRPVLAALTATAGVQALVRGDEHVVAVRLAGEDVDALGHAAAAVTEASRARPGVAFAGLFGGALDEPRLDVTVDREALARLGLTALDVSEALQLGTGMPVAWPGDVGLRVSIAGADGPLTAPDRTLVVNADGTPRVVPLSAIARVEAVVGPAALVHHDGWRTVTVVVQARGDGDAGAEARAALTATALPAGVTATIEPVRDTPP